MSWFRNGMCHVSEKNPVISGTFTFYHFVLLQSQFLMHKLCQLPMFDGQISSHLWIFFQGPRALFRMASSCETGYCCLVLGSSALEMDRTARNS